VQKVESVPSVSGISRVWGRLSDGDLWELDVDDAEGLGYKNLQSFSSCLKYAAAKSLPEGGSYDLHSRDGKLYFQVKR
jgi:hypothetical protein